MYEKNIKESYLIEGKWYPDKNLGIHSKLKYTRYSKYVGKFKGIGFNF